MKYILLIFAIIIYTFYYMEMSKITNTELQILMNSIKMYVDATLFLAGSFMYYMKEKIIEKIQNIK